VLNKDGRLVGLLSLSDIASLAYDEYGRKAVNRRVTDVECRGVGGRRFPTAPRLRLARHLVWPSRLLKHLPRDVKTFTHAVRAYGEVVATDCGRQSSRLKRPSAFVAVLGAA
jgi:hypothetical protein